MGAFYTDTKGLSNPQILFDSESCTWDSSLVNASSLTRQPRCMMGNAISFALFGLHSRRCGAPNATQRQSRAGRSGAARGGGERLGLKAVSPLIQPYLISDSALRLQWRSRDMSCLAAWHTVTAQNTRQRFEAGAL